MLSTEYIAGYFDADGFVGLRRYPHLSGYGYYPQLAVAGTDEHMISTIAEALAHQGVMCSISYSPMGDKHKDVWRLAISEHDNMTKFCDLLSQLLVLKKERLLLVSRWLDISRTKKKGVAVDEEERIYEEMKRLNKRGK